MEMKFNETTVGCMESLTSQRQQQEQTLEMRLPDGMPDAGRILGVWGAAGDPRERMGNRKHWCIRRDHGVGTLCTGGRNCTQKHGGVDALSNAVGCTGSWFRRFYLH